MRWGLGGKRAAAVSGGSGGIVEFGLSGHRRVGVPR